MNSEARVMPMPSTTGTEDKAARTEAERSERQRSADSLLSWQREVRIREQLVLKEKFDSEGAVMVESFKRGEPYYRVEVWQSRAIVNDGVVAIEKEPVKTQT